MTGSWSAFASFLLIFTLSPQLAVAGKNKEVKPVVIDDQLSGSDAKDTILKSRHAKPHKLHLEQGMLYVIDLTSKDFDAYLRLQDAAGTTRAEDDDGGGGYNARLFFIPPTTGAYTAIVTAADGKTGKYRLTVQEAHLPSEPIKLKQGTADVKDKLTLTGPRSPFSPHTNSKLYRVELKAGKSYVIDLQSAAFDAYLTLADASLRQLASDDDSGGKRNARIRFPCKHDGTYYIVATGLGHPEGAFELRVHAE